MSRPWVATNCKYCGKFVGYSDEAFCEECGASICEKHRAREDPAVFVRSGQTVKDRRLCYDCASKVADREAWKSRELY